MEKLVLKDNNPKNYVVSSLPDGTNFVHDKESGENFFDQKSIRELTGLSRNVVSHHISEYKRVASNSQIMGIALKVVNSTKPVIFYPFNVLTYVAYRSNKPKAIQYRDYVEQALNEKFNRDVGFTRPEKSLETEANKILIGSDNYGKISNVRNPYVSLHIVGSYRPVVFKDFMFFNYVSNRVNTREALQMQIYISDAIDERFNRDVGFTKSEQSLEQEAKETIVYLQSKVWDETKLAFESTNKEDFNFHMDLADKYSMDATKRRFFFLFFLF